jgi:hypothetical protein
MDISKVLNYSALFVAIATCAFVFLMYKRVTARLDGLTQAQLGLSRTLQHMVSASLGNPPGLAGVAGGAVVTSDASGSNSFESGQLVPSDGNRGSEDAVRRITVSDDDVSSGSYESESESESGDDISVSSEEGLIESGSESESSEDEAIEYDVPKVVQLAETDEISLDGGLVSVTETLSGIQPSDRIEEVHAIKIESGDGVQNEEDEDSDADSNASQDSEDLKVIDDIILDTEQDSEDEQVASATEQAQPSAQDVLEPEQAEIKVSAHSDEYIEHVKHAKVEELRKLVVDKNIMDEAKAKNTKKKALVDLLIQ